MNPTTKKGQRDLGKLREKYRAELVPAKTAADKRSGTLVYCTKDDVDLRVDVPQPGSLAWYDDRGIEPPIAVPAPSRWRTQDALAMLSGALEHQTKLRPYDAIACRLLMQAATRINVALMRGTT